MWCEHALTALKKDMAEGSVKSYKTEYTAVWIDELEVHIGDKVTSPELEKSGELHWYYIGDVSGTAVIMNLDKG